MKRESIHANKKLHRGPQVGRFGGLGRFTVPDHAPKSSWWASANGDFYKQAKSELPRILQSKIHHQIQAVRIIGQYGCE